LFTERQIEIILKKRARASAWDVSNNPSRGAYYRQVSQSRKKISGLYYSVILLEALNVISPHDDVISRLVEQVRVIKNSESVPENHEQVMNIIEKVVSDIVDL